MATIEELLAANGLKAPGAQPAPVVENPYPPIRGMNNPPAVRAATSLGRSGVPWAPEIMQGGPVAPELMDAAAEARRREAPPAVPVAAPRMSPDQMAMQEAIALTPSRPGSPGGFVAPLPYRKGTLEEEQRLALEGKLVASQGMADEQAKLAARQASAVETADMHRANAGVEEQAAEVQRAKESAYREETQRKIEELAAQKIDPDRYFHSKDTGTRVLMGLGGFLGGLVGYGQGPNQFLAHMERQQERDIDAQKAAFENKRASLSARNTAYGQLVQAGMTDQQARDRLKLMQFDAVKANLEGQMAGIDNQAAQTRFKQAILGIDQQKMELQKKYDAMQYRSPTAGGPNMHDRMAAFYKAREHQLAVEDRSIKREEIQAKEGSEAQKGATEIAKAVGAEADTAALVDQLSGQYMAPGERGSKIRAGVGMVPEKVWNVPMVGPKLYQYLYEPDATATEQGWQQYKQKYRQMMTGAGFSPSESEDYYKTLESAGDTASRLRALENTRQAVAAKVIAARSGQSASANRRFDEGAARNIPIPVSTPGFSENNR